MFKLFADVSTPGMRIYDEPDSESAIVVASIIAVATIAIVATITIGVISKKKNKSVIAAPKEELAEKPKEESTEESTEEPTEEPAEKTE